jgi:hypothetical protein
VSLAIEEIERAVGRLRSAANFLDPKGNVSTSGSKKKSVKKPSGLKIFSKKTKQKNEAKKTLARKATKARGAERQRRKREVR